MVYISKKNSKIGNIPNISLPPVITCPNCKHCSAKCYALKAYRMYPSTKKAWDDNFKEAEKRSDVFFKEIENYLDKKRPKYFRIHVSGDFFSQAYLNGWKELAKNHPGTKFLAFTKAFKLDYTGVPDNLQIVWSVFPGMSSGEVPLYGPRAYAGNTGISRNKERVLDCNGDCEHCGICWNLPQDMAVHFEMH